MSAPRIAISIVTFNSAEVVTSLLDSLLYLGSCEWADPELVVVDNNSSDATVRVVREWSRIHPRVILTVISCGTNGGWGKGNNMAFAAMRPGTDLFLLLNPDARIGESALAALVTAWERRGTIGGIWVPVCHDRGSVHALARTIPSLAQRYIRGLVPSKGSHVVGDEDPVVRGPLAGQYASGACALYDVSSYASIGGCDPAIFLYNDDVDLGVRAQRFGIGTFVVRSATIEHAVGKGSRIANDDSAGSRRLAMYFQSEFVFVQKHHGVAAAVCLAVWRCSAYPILLATARRTAGLPRLDYRLLWMTAWHFLRER